MPDRFRAVFEEVVALTTKKVKGEKNTKYPTELASNEMFKPYRCFGEMHN